PSNGRVGATNPIHSSVRRMAYEPKQAPKQAQDLSSTKASTAPVDYYSVLTNVIALVMKDPAQMRSLVYELARVTLKREAWNRFPPLQGAELKAQLSTLEQAIARVELDAQANRLRQTEALREVARIADENYQPPAREVIILPERPSLTQAGRALHVPEQRRSF